MRTTVTRTLTRAQRTFGEFTIGQRFVSVIGTAALLLAGFVAFQWAVAPSYAPLFSDLAASDASAVIEELDARGIPYEIADGGGTIMVPRDEVYPARITLSGEGLPSDSSSGYSILDNQGLSTSQFKEQTDFKRAMEGELAATIESIDDVETAIVHLAMPPTRVFADEQDPKTASILVDTRAGRSLEPGQVQAIVNLVASSIDGLSPDAVTVADSTGAVLSAPGGSLAASASTRTQQVDTFQDRMRGQVQSMLDRVLGVGNSAVQVTANLSFDKTVTNTTRYFDNPLAVASTETTETYKGPESGQVGGVVGPDGQMDPTASPTQDAQYSKSSRSSDNALNRTIERREAAPGGVESLHVGVVLDRDSLNGVDPRDIEDLVASALGIDEERGDTVQVSAMPFDRSSEQAMTEELAAARKADEKAAMITLGRNGALGLLGAIVLAVAWRRSRKRAAARDADDTRTWVEQLRRGGAVEAGTDAAAVGGANPAVLALDAAEGRSAEIREELATMVGRQPEDVAALLRGWLVERP